MKSIPNFTSKLFLLFVLLISHNSFGGGSGPIWPFGKGTSVWSFDQSVNFDQSANVIAVRLNQNQVSVTVFGVKPSSNYKVSLTEVEHGLLPDPINGPDENKKPILKLEFIKQDNLGNPVITPFVVAIILNSNKDSFWFINGKNKPEEIKVALPS